MREIPLTRNQVSIVDDADYEWLNQYTWRASWSDTSQSFYASRITSRKEGRRKTILMHREILGLANGDPRRGDHIETGNTLDNRRSNLRIATHSQNNCNCRKRSHNTSGFKGVYLSKGRYHVAQIVVDGVHHYLGTFSTAEEGHKAYREAAERLHGEFARGA